MGGIMKSFSAVLWRSNWLMPIGVMEVWMEMA